MTCHLPSKQPSLSADSYRYFHLFKKQPRLWRHGQSFGRSYGTELNGRETSPLLPAGRAQPNSSELSQNPPHWYIPFHTLTSVFNIYWKPLKRRSSSCVREMFESLAVGCVFCLHNKQFIRLYYQSFHYCIFWSKSGGLYKGHSFSYFPKIQVSKFQLEAPWRQCRGFSYSGQNSQLLGLSPTHTCRINGGWAIKKCQTGSFLCVTSDAAKTLVDMIFLVFFWHKLEMHYSASQPIVLSTEKSQPS